MRAQFIRNIDPKDAMHTGDELIRQLKKVEEAVRKLAQQYGAEKTIVYDDNNYLVSFSNKKHTFFIGINPEFPEMEDGYPYNVGVEKLGEEANHDNYFDEDCRSFSEALTRLKFHIEVYDIKDDEISESHNFQRNIDPKIAMSTGDEEYRQKKEQLKTLHWKLKYMVDKNERWATHNKIRVLQYETETAEERRKRMASEQRAWDKIVKKREERDKQRKKELKTITPKQKAINQIIDRLYWIRIQQQDKFLNNLLSIKNLRKEIDLLKSKYNIKSTDLRRQKKYDPKYDDMVKESHAPYDEGPDTSFVKVDIDDAGIVQITRAHYTAEDDYDVDEKTSIDPGDMDLFLAKKLGFNIETFFNSDDLDEITIDIKYVREVDKDTWYFDTNYGSVEISLDELEKLIT